MLQKNGGATAAATTHSSTAATTRTCNPCTGNRHARWSHHWSMGASAIMPCVASNRCSKESVTNSNHSPTLTFWKILHLCQMSTVYSLPLQMPGVKQPQHNTNLFLRNKFLQSLSPQQWILLFTGDAVFCIQPYSANLPHPVSSLLHDPLTNSTTLPLFTPIHTGEG